MVRLRTWIVLAGALLLQGAALAADLRALTPRVGFQATCEDLGTFCFAEACGRDQIDAAQNCRARCPSASIMSVIPGACRPPETQPLALFRPGG